MKKFFTTLAFCVLAVATSYGQFFTNVSYRGAFDKASVAGSNWTSPWANFNPVNTAYPGDNGNNLGKVIKHIPDSTRYGIEAGAVSINPVWSADTTYILDGQVFVKNGGTLTIQPGTIIRGVSAGPGQNPAFLCVAQGGKIYAVGTPTAPIVMTSNNPPSTRATGDWGGLLLCGKAKTNLNNTVTGNIGGRRFEATPGYPETYYGGTDDNDNSGALKYVRVEFAGDARLVDQELNGIMFAGLGNQTSIDYVQVAYANDDSFEWFGGTVNCKHLIAFAGTDDDYDMDEGFSGKLQFLLGVRHPSSFDVSGAGADNSNGFEIDDNTTSGGAATGSQSEASPKPLTNPIISNVTMVGPLRPGEVTATVNNAFGWGARFRTNASPAIFNSIFLGYQQMFDIPTANITGLTMSTKTSGIVKFSCDSSTLRNCVLLQDPANTFKLFTMQNNLGNTALMCTPIPSLTSFTVLKGILTSRGTVYDSATSTAAAIIGFTQPYYTGTISGTAFGQAGTSSFATVNYTLTNTSPYATGAAFADARVSPTTNGNLVVSTTTAPAAGVYDNVTITSTGVANLSGNLSVIGNITVQSGGVLNLGTNALVNSASLTVNAGGTVKSANTTGLTTAGALQNTGGVVFDAASNIVLNSASASPQSISSFISSVGNLEVANVGGLGLLGTPLIVNGILDLTSGTVTTFGNLTINSTATRQGIIDDFSAGNSGSVSGQVKFRRYTSGNYTHVSAPLAGLTNDVFTTAFGAGNLKEFNEPGNNWGNADETGGASFDQVSSRIIVKLATAKTLEFAGTVSNGVKTVNMVRSATVVGINKGWNGLGNPYTSPINWSLVRNIAGNTTNSNLTAYVWSSSANNYGIITAAGVATLGANNVIAPGQGFIVRTFANGGTLTLNNTVRVSSSTNTFIREGANTEVIRLAMANDNGADEAFVTTEGTSSEKLFSPIATAPSLYIRGTEALSVASVSAITADSRFAIGTKGAGVVTVKNLDVPAGLTAYLVNSTTGSIQTISEGSTFKVSDADNYAVVFRTGVAEKVAALYAYVSNNGIQVVLNGNANGSTIEVLDAAGKLVSRTAAAANAAETTVAAPATPGVYQIRVSGSVNGVTRVAAGF